MDNPELMAGQSLASLVSHVGSHYGELRTKFEAFFRSLPNSHDKQLVEEAALVGSVYSCAMVGRREAAELLAEFVALWNPTPIVPPPGTN